MSLAVASYVVEERINCGEKPWIAIRARGAEWSWLTPEEAVAIGRAWLEKYGHANADACCSAAGPGKSEAGS
jgi:hypothetical protein